MRKDHENSGLGNSTPRPFKRSHGLPHINFDGAEQFITFRLRDAAPPGTFRRSPFSEATPTPLLPGIAPNSSPAPRPKRGVEVIDTHDADLDRGYGRCILKRTECAAIVVEAFRSWDGERYELRAFVVMPNHVHVLIRPFDGIPLAKIVSTWKSHTAKRINRALGTSGPVWQSDYFDRYVRENEMPDRYVQYIHENPVKAGLVKQAEDWPFSSAREWRERAPSGCGQRPSVGCGQRPFRPWPLSGF